MVLIFFISIVQDTVSNALLMSTLASSVLLVGLGALRLSSTICNNVERSVGFEW